MASMSVRNLASHIAAVSFANFIPVAEKWSAPKALPAGCTKLLEMLKMVTGSHFKPVFPAFLLNEDCSSQYFFSGTVRNDPANNGWARVKEESYHTRGKDAIWTPDTAKDNICKGIRVKFAVYPICIQVSNLSKEELPVDDFLVIPIPGLSINGHIDPRSNEVGYLCLMGSNVPQKRFFEWFYEEITVKTCSNIRNKYNFQPSATELPEDVPLDYRFILWGDSDIPYLQQMTSPERIAMSTIMGIYFA